jgi:PKD repeat protein
MNNLTRFLIGFLLLIPCLLISQAPVANFSALIDSSCGPTLSESFTDFSSNNPTHWKWYFPGATPDTSTLRNPTNIQYKGYGCYSVKLVVSNKSGSDSLTKSNYVCLDSMPKIVIKGVFDLCHGSSTTDTIIVNGDTTYYNITGVVTKTYTFTVHNGACFKDTSLTIHVDTMPTFAFSGKTSICVGDTTVIYARSKNGKYKWSTGSTADSIVVIGKKPGNYTYYLSISKGGCSRDSTEITVKVYDCTGIDNYSNPSEFRIYPNPSNGIFILQTVSEHPIANSYIEVYNALGQQVYRSRINTNSTEINLNGQSQGVYLYRIITETGELVGKGKLVLQK